MMLWVVAVLCAHTVVVEGASDEDDSTTRRFVVEHALRPGEWSQRGSVSLDFGRELAIFDDYELDSSALESLNGLRSSDSAAYQVRVTPEGSSTPILTSVHACRFRVRQGKIEDHFVFHADLWGHVRSIDYYPRMSPERTEKRECVTNAALDPPSENGVMPLKSTGRIKLPARGSSPIVIEKASKAGGAAGGAKEEQTFFQKYWWMLLLGGFFLVAQVLNNPELQQAAAAQQAASRR